MLPCTALFCSALPRREAAARTDLSMQLVIDEAIMATEVTRIVVQLAVVLQRADLAHLHGSMTAEDVDVHCLAECEDAELAALGVDKMSARSRLRRFAKAWALLFPE